MSTRTRGTGRRPSQVLPLPEDPARWRPPAPAPPPSATDRQRRTRVVASLVLLALVGVLLATAGDDPVGPDAAPPPVTDVATEDAVVGVLLLYSAQLSLVEAAAREGGPFALPGPTARANQLQAALTDAGAVLADTRQADPAAGTPGSEYVAHPDHDALLAVAADLVETTRVVALLEEIHTAAFGGASTITPAEARDGLDRVRATAPSPATIDWATALQATIDGDPAGPVVAGTAREAAGVEWQQAADRLGPAALPTLVTFLNGIDPGVIAALDGHPVAGPALRTLRA